MGGERHELRGHQQNAAKFSGTLTATLASLAQRYGSESSAEFARVHQLCLSHACARGAIERCHRPTRRCADATDAIEPALRLPADVDAPDFFALSILAISGLGPTMELGRSAALVRWRTMSTAIAGAVSVLAWSGRRQVRWVASATSYGVINKTRPNSPALSLLRLPRSLNATAPKAQRNLPAFTSYVCLMRAREAPSSGATDRPAGAPMRLTRSSRRCGCRPMSTRRIKQ